MSFLIKLPSFWSGNNCSRLDRGLKKEKKKLAKLVICCTLSDTHCEPRSSKKCLFDVPPGVSQCLCFRVDELRRWAGYSVSRAATESALEQVVRSCRCLPNELTHPNLNDGFCACVTACVLSILLVQVTVAGSHKVYRCNRRGVAPRCLAIDPFSKNCRFSWSTFQSMWKNIDIDILGNLQSLWWFNQWVCILICAGFLQILFISRTMQKENICMKAVMSTVCSASS